MGSLDGNANDSATDQEIQASDAKKQKPGFAGKPGFTTKHRDSATLAKSGNTGGNIGPNSDQIDLLIARLAFDGFTPEQIEKILAALRASGNTRAVG